MFRLLSPVVEALQPILVPLCFIFAWLFALLLGLTLFSSLRDALRRAKQMHSIPCADCQFFTNDYRLKCTVHPGAANTEQAIGCRDYSSASRPFSVP
ncbi:MAG: hypothetical protein HC890_16305 [Chloroflexaceae bacterium]|nr:hypothetical protein [Chloroflexaceae bacterium]